MGALFRSNASTTQTSSQTTNQQDNRIVNGDGAIAFSNSTGNSISSNSDSHNVTNYTSTTTDLGAVQGSMALIASGMQHNAGMFQSALSTGEHFFDSGIGFADHALQGVMSNSNALMQTTEQILNGQATTQANATAAIKDAFTTAKSGEQRIMVGAALAIVAIVALRK